MPFYWGMVCFEKSNGSSWVQNRLSLRQQSETAVYCLGCNLLLPYHTMSFLASGTFNKVEYGVLYPKYCDFYIAEQSGRIMEAVFLFQPDYLLYTTQHIRRRKISCNAAASQSLFASFLRSWEVVIEYNSSSTAFYNTHQVLCDV